MVVGEGIGAEGSMGGQLSNRDFVGSGAAGGRITYVSISS